MHVWWDYGAKRLFCNMIRKEMRKITGYFLSYDPEVFLLHNFEICMDPCENKLLIINALVTARNLAAGNWKLRHLASRAEWLQKLTEPF